MGLIKAKIAEHSYQDSAEFWQAEDLPMLLEGLRSPQDEELRRMSARDLENYPEAVPELLSQLEIEHCSSVSDAILIALARIGNTEAVQGILPFLRSEDASLRNAAIEVLKDLPDTVAPHMEALLCDSDPDVRIFAVNILESLRHPKVVEWLLEVIESDEHVNVCATALDLLAEVGDEACLDGLQQLKTRFPHEPYLRFAVDTAMVRIKELKGDAG